MKRMWVTIAFAGLVGVLLLVLAKSFGTNPRAVPFMLAGQPAPSFVVKNLQTGQRVSMADFKGRPLVINFWASWCEPCKAEHPVLEWGARQFSDQAQFIGVIFEDTEENAQRYLSRHGTSFPQMLDPLSRMAVDYGCSGVPETYFVDSQGIIVDKHLGPIDPQSLTTQVRNLVARGNPQAANAGGSK
ncbi:MAG: redoxin domain-containing protein [Myxococcota bacterium]|nr:redoxin domain-containing protein [Myxococcota bacterium]